MDRRSFIKLTAVTGTTATLAACSGADPANQLIRFVPEDDLTPGLADWKPSVCALCPAGCGLTVRVMEADAQVVRNGTRGAMRMNVAKKLEGSAAHPISQGALCARGQAGVQVTYHPDRLAQPMKRSGARGSGSFQPIGWDEALAEVVARLDGLARADRQRRLAFWTTRRRGLRHALVAEFLARFGAPPPIVHEPFGDDVLRRANALSFGREQLPTIDLARANLVVSFGADLLGTWNSPVAQSAAYGRMRRGRPGTRGKLVQVEARMSQTAANADDWIACAPGTEGVLALGLAHAIVAAKLRPASAAGAAGALVDGWNDGLAEYTPAEVERRTGVPSARIDALAHELVDRAPSVAVIGGAPLAHTNGLAQAIAVNALNALVGAVEQPGGVFFMPQVEWPGLAKIATKPGAPANPGDQIEMLWLDGANPIFTSPASMGVRESIAQIPFIVSFGSFVDETSAYADLLLPDHSPLESWVDHAPESGAPEPVASVAAPVMRALHDTRPTPDVVLDLARRLARPLAPPFTWQTFEEMVEDVLGDAASTAQEHGGVWGDQIPAAAIVKPSVPAAAARRVAMGAPVFDGGADQFPLHLLPYPSTAFLDGSLAHLPWLQELPDPITSAMWSSWVELNPRTAARLGIAHGDLVQVTSPHGSLAAPAFVWPGIAPDVVAMPAGQGHTTFTRYASGRGANPFAILSPTREAETSALAWAATRVRVSRIGGADGSLITFAAELRERPTEGR